MRQLKDERGGGVAVIAAVSGGLLCALAGVTVDVGSVALEARRVQGAADLAALTAASDLARAEAAARATVLANGRAEAIEVATGRWVPAPDLMPAQRFTEGPAATANAARVRVRAEAPLYFGRVLLGRDTTPVVRTATAARKARPTAAFSIGSRLARVDGGVANAVLSALAGSRVGLEVMDYQALARADVDLATWLDALRAELDLKAGGFDTLLAAEADTGRALAVLASLLDDPVAKSAAGDLASAAKGRTLRLGDLVKGDAVNVRGLKAELSALDLASTVLETSNGARQADLDLSARPGLADLDVRLAIGERPNGSPWLAVTEAGQPVVRTAQTRLRVRARTSQGLAALGQANVPVVVELAASEAYLDRIDCEAGSVRLRARPGVSRAWVGEVSDAALSDFKTPLAPQKADLLSVAGLVRIKARADVEVADLDHRPVDFTVADIAEGRVRTVTSRDTATSLLTSLVGRTELEVEALGVGLGLGALKAQTQALLAPIGPALDAALAPLLNVLGLKVGEADLRVHGLRCPARGRLDAELVG